MAIFEPISLYTLLLCIAISYVFEMLLNMHNILDSTAILNILVKIPKPIAEEVLYTETLRNFRSSQLWKILKYLAYIAVCCCIIILLNMYFKLNIYSLGCWKPYPAMVIEMYIYIQICIYFVIPYFFPDFFQKQNFFQKIIPKFFQKYVFLIFGSSDDDEILGELNDLKQKIRDIKQKQYDDEQDNIRHEWEKQQTEWEKQYGGPPNQYIPDDEIDRDIKQIANATDNPLTFNMLGNVENTHDNRQSIKALYLILHPDKCKIGDNDKCKLLSQRLTEKKYSPWRYN